MVPGLDLPFLNLETMVTHFIFIVMIITIYALAFRYVMESRFKWVRPSWMVWLLLDGATFDFGHCLELG